MTGQVEIEISCLSKEEIIKRFVELEKENHSLYLRFIILDEAYEDGKIINHALINQNEAMSKRLDNQCELLEKMRKGNEKLVKERDELYNLNHELSKMISEQDEILRIRPF